MSYRLLFPIPFQQCRTYKKPSGRPFPSRTRLAKLEPTSRFEKRRLKFGGLSGKKDDFRTTLSPPKIPSFQPRFSQKDAPHMRVEERKFPEQRRVERTFPEQRRVERTFPQQRRVGERTSSKAPDAWPKVERKSDTWPKVERKSDTWPKERTFSMSRPPVKNPILMDNPERPDSSQERKRFFKSPPLLQGLLDSLHASIGSEAKPTPIQQLSMAYFFNKRETDINLSGKGLKILLAAQTGSGKSIAYLLPLLQSLKLSELDPSFPTRHISQPRALILSPTHELARQLSMFSKTLSHQIKLRTLCLSKPNKAPTTTSMNLIPETTGEFEIKGDPKGISRPIDVLVGTPARILELIRGRAWDKDEKVPWDGIPKGPEGWKPELGLEHVQWVVVDEADVLFDRDFLDTTKGLLEDIQKAQGGSFNLILCSATIPNSLDAYLKENHPSLVRLVDPKLHQLPCNLKPEFVNVKGNRFSELFHRITQVWAEEARRNIQSQSSLPKSKILIFCNKTNKVTEVAEYLAEKGIEAVPMTSDGSVRKKGHDMHLLPFLKTTAASPPGPNVLVSTSMLSRGLDFSSDVKHVFILDEPRNMVDFLHRAGRTGRAENEGKVVIFSKEKGRGATVGKEVRKRVAALTS